MLSDTTRLSINVRIYQWLEILDYLAWKEIKQHFVIKAAELPKTLSCGWESVQFY